MAPAPVGGSSAFFCGVSLVLEFVLRLGGVRSSPCAGWRKEGFPDPGRFRNHERAIPKPRGQRLRNPEKAVASVHSFRSVGVTETTIENGPPFHGADRAEAGGGGSRGGGNGRLLHLRPALGLAQGRHGVDGASAVHAGDAAGPADPALRARGGENRGDALGEGARHHPRQGRADLLREPPDGGAEGGQGHEPGPAPQGLRPPRGDAAGDERGRLPAAPGGAGAALGDADRHQHRHGRGGVDARLRADRRLGDPAQDQGRADDPRDGARSRTGCTARWSRSWC